ncbi:MAG TPA: ornithine carbamoyltransferase [Thermomicrobiales bacterium]|nr:ornithine carbamoyltransferase [Thermomicrobiales bacterium]
MTAATTSPSNHLSDLATMLRQSPGGAATASLAGRSVLSDLDLSAAEMAGLIETALWLKALREAGSPHPLLFGKTLGMIFQHPSTRTRNAFEAGMEQLGGHATFLGVNDLQLTRGETLPDTAHIMSGYVDGIAGRFARQADLEAFAAGARVPVYNGLTERFHPIEALSDLLTLRARFGDLRGLKLAYVGDGNNVCHSLLLSAASCGLDVAVASPDAFQPDQNLVASARERAAVAGSTITLTGDPFAAAAGADAIYTDVHESMGQPDAAERRAALAPYKVTAEFMAAAKPSAVFMHCLPMHRGEEVDADVADGPQSIVYEQAENRLHMHKALLLRTLADAGERS